MKRNTTQINDRMVRTTEMMTIKEMTDRRVTRIGEPSPVGADSMSWPTTATRVTYGLFGFERRIEEKEAEMKRE